MMMMLINIPILCISMFNSPLDLQRRILYSGSVLPMRPDVKPGKHQCFVACSCCYPLYVWFLFGSTKLSVLVLHIIWVLRISWDVYNANFENFLNCVSWEFWEIFEMYIMGILRIFRVVIMGILGNFWVVYHGRFENNLSCVSWEFWEIF
jgi:hypothetical protein